MHTSNRDEEVECLLAVIKSVFNAENLSLYNVVPGAMREFHCMLQVTWALIEQQRREKYPP